jgi:hypothetical protein
LHVHIVLDTFRLGECGRGTPNCARMLLRSRSSKKRVLRKWNSRRQPPKQPVLGHNSECIEPWLSASKRG